MTHYIADAAHPCHAAADEHGGLHSWLEREVSKYTLLRHYRTNIVGNNFFTIDLASKIKYSSDKLRDNLNGRQCVDMMVRIVLENNEDFLDGSASGSGIYNIDWIFNFYDTHGRDSVDFDSIDRNDEEFKPFFDRIEILLNWAVYFTACALKHYIGIFDGVCPDCSENDDDDPNSNSGDRLPDLEFLNFASRYALYVAAFVVAGVGLKKLLGFR